MKLKVGKLSFYVVESGSGEPALLFLHYWGGSARTWNVVISELSSSFRCVAYDQRGWGQSDAPEQGYSRFGSGCRANCGNTTAEPLRLGGSFYGRESCSTPGIAAAAWASGTCSGCARASNAAKHSGTCEASTASRL